MLAIKGDEPLIVCGAASFAARLIEDETLKLSPS